LAQVSGSERWYIFSKGIAVRAEFRAPDAPVMKPANKRPTGIVLGKGQGKMGEYNLMKVPFIKKGT
jgi:hypothetical protein